jgi:hypothetical protein
VNINIYAFVFLAVVGIVAYLIGGTTWMLIAIATSLTISLVRGFPKR